MRHIKPRPKLLEELTVKEAFDRGHSIGFDKGYASGHQEGSEAYRARFSLVLGILIGISIVGFILWMGK